MHIFDRVDPMLLERRSAQLRVLAIFIVLILAVGVALLAYPPAFSRPVSISGPTMRRLFFAFCGLSSLIVAYLTDRHVLLEQLQRKLRAEESRSSGLLLQASVDLLGILPNFEHFRDRLSMEFRRAALGTQPLSLISVTLEGANSPADDMIAIQGDAVKSMLRRLRNKDSIYCIREGVFAAILPGAGRDDAVRVADRLATGLQDLAGTKPTFQFHLNVINYPDDARSAREIENLAKTAYVPRPKLALAS